MLTKIRNLENQDVLSCHAAAAVFRRRTGKGARGAAEWSSAAAAAAAAPCVCPCAAASGWLKARPERPNKQTYLSQF
jgi:hypothetical protein